MSNATLTLKFCGDDVKDAKHLCANISDSVCYNVIMQRYLSVYFVQNFVQNKYLLYQYLCNEHYPVRSVRFLCQTPWQLPPRPKHLCRILVLGRRPQRQNHPRHHHKLCPIFPRKILLHDHVLHRFPCPILGVLELINVFLEIIPNPNTFSFLGCLI